MLDIDFKDYLNRGQCLNEASFSEDRIKKVSDLMVKIAGKKLGGRFYNVGLENFVSKIHGKGSGLRYITETGVQLRFNWNKTNKSKYIISSIDYWSASNRTFNKPTSVVTIGGGVNVVEILGKIMEAFKTNRLVESGIVSEARKNDKFSRAEWLKSKGLATSYADSDKNTRRKAQKAGLEADYDFFMGQEETNSFEEELKDAEKAVEKQTYSDPDVVFKDVEDLTAAVASGVATSLIVAGAPGVGKCVGGDTVVNIKGL